MLGAGFMARTHTQAARVAGAKLEAIAASTPSRSTAAATELGYAESGTTDEIAAAGYDVVHVCTPNTTHLELSRRALAAGSFVICEKPLATNTEDARALVQQAADLGVAGAVPFVYRYHPLVREARARVRSGEIGRVLTISGVYLQDWLLGETDDNWRVHAASGGPSRAFADIGSHLVDLIEFVTGERIVKLSAITSTVYDERGGSTVDTEDAAALAVQLSGGAIGSLLISQVAPGRKNGLALEISGNTESLRFEQEDPERLWVGRREHSYLLRRDPDLLSPEAARVNTLPAGHPQGYQDAFNAFIADAYVAASGSGVPDGMPTFADGLRATILTDAVLESVRTGTWVEVASA